MRIGNLFDLVVRLYHSLLVEGTTRNKFELLSMRLESIYEMTKCSFFLDFVKLDALKRSLI